MRIAKHYITIVALLSISQLHAQKDSVEALFKSPKFSIHYSYLQFELGYSGFAFSNAFLNGSSYDIIGAVFNNDFSIAIGFDGASGSTRSMPYFSNTSTIVDSYNDFYFKAEPLLFPDKLLNFSMPVKLCVANLGYPIYNPNGRRRTRNYAFTAVTAGAYLYVNVFRALSMGMGADYRLSLSSSGSVSKSDYSNFSFSVLMRFKVNTHTTGRRLAAKKKDYYNPKDRFQ